MFPADADIQKDKIDIFATNHPNHHEQKGILFKYESFQINSCIYAVNKKLGTGFLEAVYQEALEIELRRKNIPFVSHQELEILYDGIPLSSKYIVDIICYNKIIIELKSVTNLNNQHKAQLMNYLTVTGLNLGLLVNFNSFPKTDNQDSQIKPADKRFVMVRVVCGKILH